MVVVKEREELKARLQKISQNKKESTATVPRTPVTPQIPDQDEEVQDLSALEAEFEAKKRAIEEKQRKAQIAEDEQVPTNEIQIAQAIDEYHNDGKFRVELIFQLVAMNNTLKDISAKLGGLGNE